MKISNYLSAFISNSRIFSSHPERRINGVQILLERTAALFCGGCFSRLSSYAIRIPRGPRYAVIIRRFTGSSSEWRWGWEDFVKSFAHEMGRLSFSLRGPSFILSLRLNAKAIPPRASSKRASPCYLWRRKLICLRLCQRKSQKHVGKKKGKIDTVNMRWDGYRMYILL